MSDSGDELSFLEFLRADNSANPVTAPTSSAQNIAAQTRANTARASRAASQAPQPQTPLRAAPSLAALRTPLRARPSLPFFRTSSSTQTPSTPSLFTTTPSSTRNFSRPFTTTTTTTTLSSPSNHQQQPATPGSDKDLPSDAQSHNKETAKDGSSKSKLDKFKFWKRFSKHRDSNKQHAKDDARKE